MALNTEYLKSAQGILKILEFITICIAFPCLVDYELKQTVVFGEELIPRAWFFFFVAVFVIGLLAVLLIFSVLAFSLTEKNLNFVLYIFSFLLALLFLVASVRMADFMKKEYELAKIHKAFGFHGHSDIITVSVSFSLVSTFLLAVDVYLFYKKRKSGSANEARGQTEV